MVTRYPVTCGSRGTICYKYLYILVYFIILTSALNINQMATLILNIIFGFIVFF